MRRPPDPERISARTTQLLADLVQPTKSDALEKLGEGERAFGIANEWLRTKFIVTPVPVPDTPTL